MKVACLWFTTIDDFLRSSEERKSSWKLLEHGVERGAMILLRNVDNVLKNKSEIQPGEETHL